MPITQIRGAQIQDGSITADDVDDNLEKALTKVRVTTNDSTADFLSSKIIAGTGIAVTVVGVSGSAQTLQIAATGGGGGGGVSDDFFGGQFGDGSDGDLTVVGTFTAAKEMHFSNLTIPTGTTFKPNGHRIFVSNTLSIAAGTSFNDDGNNATNQAGGLGLASRNYLVAASGQGSNGVALTAVNWSNATAGSNSTNSSPNNLNQAAKS